MQLIAGGRPEGLGAVCESEATFSHLIQTLVRPVQRVNICSAEKVPIIKCLNYFWHCCYCFRLTL